MKSFRIDLATMASLAFGLFTVAAPTLANAEKVTPPAVPDKLKVEAGNTAFLVGHASGTQDYICLPSGAGFAWTLFTPQATLFNGASKQVITHFFSPNPSEHGTIRVTWQDSQDASTVWGKLVQSSAEAPFVAPDAIPWLLLDVKDTGARKGPTGGGALTATTFVQRVNTAGGVAPPTGCAQLGDVGAKAFVPYSADYVFFRSTARNDAEGGK